MPDYSRFPTRYDRYSPREKMRHWGWSILCAAIVIWALRAMEINWHFLADAHVQAYDLADRLWPPRWDYAPKIMGALVETVHIGTLGTMISFVLAVPVAFISARNTSFNGLTWAIGRVILVLSRSINTVIWGLLFVAIFGPGPVAGICAVAARSVGFIAKLISEAIEEVDAGQIEAIEATGATRLQIWATAIWPQIQPALIGTSVYRWDINIRESSVLGFVGAGGIGLYLYSSINSFAWNQVLLILVAILVLVVISEVISAWVRGKLT